MNTRLGPDLRAMIWKETKENARWAVLAMIGVALALVFTISHQMGGNASNSFSAVWDSVGLVMTFGAPVVGLAFGLLQILPELRRDQWAFLVHRPTPRATLFWGKALAGMGLTVLATLIPLLGLALWAQAPGHIPAPFDARLLLGGLAAILTGLVFHTAGLLTALRPARWYGSRALPVAMAVVCALLVTNAREFYQAVAWVALFLTVLLFAARGSFLTTGHYLQQPRTAKIGLGIAFYVGLVATLIAAAGVIGSTITTLFPGRPTHRTWTRYQITQSGRILLVTSDNETIIRATDLSGHSVTLPPSTNGYNGGNFLFEQSLAFGQRIDRENFNTSRRYATLLGTAGFLESGTIWYYVPSRQQVLAYSLQNRRLLGRLGPSGFSMRGGATHFTGPLLFDTAHEDFNQTHTLLAFPHSLYLLDTDKRSVMPLLITPGDIRDVTRMPPSSLISSDSPDVGMPYVVTTGDSFSLFSPTGRPLFTIPREYDRRTYPDVTVAMTTIRRRFFFEYIPHWTGGMPQRLPSHITEFNPDGTVVRRDVLPPISGPAGAEPPWTVSLFGLLSPPTLTVVANILGILGRHSTEGFMHSFWLMLSQYPRLWIGLCSASLFSGLLSGVLAWRIGRRCVFTRGGQWAWAVGVFWLGLPGVLLLLSLRDWPAREPCPNCGRLRVVARERCEHCGAGFPAPTRDGTEIFERGDQQAVPPLVPSG